MLLAAEFVVVTVLCILTTASYVLASTKSASKQKVEADPNWFKANITRRSGHHHHFHQHVDIVENASHPPAAVIRAPPLVAPVVPAVSVAVPVHAVPAVPQPTVSTVFTPSVLTVLRRPVVTTSFLHSPPPPAPHPPVVPVVHHHVAAAAAPTPVPVYTTFISHAPPPPVKQRTVLLHHHHHHLDAKPLSLSNIPVVLDPIAYNRKFQNSASDDEVIIKERDLAQLLQGKYTQFRGSWDEPTERHHSRQDYHERKRKKYFYSASTRMYRGSRKFHSRQHDPVDMDDEAQGPNLGENSYSSRDRGERLDLSYAVRADRTLNGRNVVVIIPKK